MAELAQPDAVLMRGDQRTDRRLTIAQGGWPALLGACLGASILSGCALTRPPEHAQTVEQALPKGTTIPPDWRAAAGPTDAVADDWLRSFADPGLDAVVAEAIRNNPDLRQAAARVESARQIVAVVGARLKPHIGGQAAGAVTQDVSQSSTFYSQLEYLGLTWELDVWGRLRAQRAAAQAGFEATALDYAFARQSLAATTAKSWYLAIETRQLLGLAGQSVRIYSNLLELAQVRYAAGKVTALDVAESSASRNEAESQLRSAQSFYGEARRNLEVLVGRYPGAELEVAEAFVPLPPPVRAGLPASLLERRPDLVAAERKILAAFRTLEASRLALLPSITLTVEGGHLSDRLLDLLSLNPVLFRSALGLFAPIYEGGALRAKVKIATAQQEDALAGYGSVVLKAFQEVEVALTNEILLGESLRYQESALKDRTETVRVATLRYEGGALDLLSVLQLQAVQLAVQGEVVKTRNARLANRITLHLALGGSFDAAPAGDLPKTVSVTFDRQTASSGP